MRNRITLVVPWLFSVAIYGSLPHTSAWGQVGFTPLGDLPGGQVRSDAFAVSGNGLVVVGASSSSFSMQRDEAFRWTADQGMRGLGAIPDPFPPPVSFAYGVSNNGDVIVGRSGLVDSQPFRWTASGGMLGLGRLPGGTPGGFALSTSADGSVVVGQSGASGKAFRWTAAEGMVPLAGPPSAIFSTANDVSADGDVIVGTIEVGGSQQAFRWTDETGVVPFGPGGATAVSADGLVVVGFSGQAFRWTAQSGMVRLGDLPEGPSSSAGFDVSADGSVVVGFGETDSGREAMFWTQATGMVNLRDSLVSQGLDLTAWKLLTAEGVSADGGTIVGTGVNPAGLQEGWIATIPEPSTFIMSILAALVLFAFYLRQRFAKAATAQR